MAAWSAIRTETSSAASCCPCSAEPVTGFYRDGCCATGPEDLGSHTVCAVMTEEFLDFSKRPGTTSRRRVPSGAFAGLRAGRSLVRLCLALARGVRAGVVAPVVLGATHERALEAVPIDALTATSRLPSLRDARYAGKGRAPERRCFPNGNAPIGGRRARRIETARLRLEPWDDGHFERFARFMRDPAVIRYIRADPLDRGPRQGAARALARRVGRCTASASARSWRRATDRWLGFVELNARRPRQGIARRRRRDRLLRRPVRWGEGIATEAALATRDEAFDRCGLTS